MSETPGGLKRELKRAVLSFARQLTLDTCAKKHEDVLYTSIYGDSDGAESMGREMFNGTGVWAGLFDELIMINSIDPSSQSQTKRLVVKEFLWPGSKGKQYLVGQGGLTFDGLFLKNNADVNPEDIDVRHFSPRTLQGEAQLTINTVRTATEIATTKFLKPNGDYPDGKSFLDMLLFVRQQCYRTFLGGLNTDRIDHRRAKLASPLSEPQQMPHNYYFTGMVAFCLFGPKPLSGTYLPIFNPGVETVLGKTISTGGKDENQGKSPGGILIRDATRDIGVRDLIQAAQLEQLRNTNVHKGLTDLLEASNSEVQGLISQKKTIVDQIEVCAKIPSLNSKCDDLVDKLGALDEEIDAHRKRNREWLDELDVHRKNPPKQAYQKCMKSIACDEETPVVVVPDKDNNDAQEEDR